MWSAITSFASRGPAVDLLARGWIPGQWFVTAYAPMRLLPPLPRWMEDADTAYLTWCRDLGARHSGR